MSEKSLVESLDSSFLAKVQAAIGQLPFATFFVRWSLGALGSSLCPKKAGPELGQRLLFTLAKCYSFGTSKSPAGAIVDLYLQLLGGKRSEAQFRAARKEMA